MVDGKCPLMMGKTIHVDNSDAVSEIKAAMNPDGKKQKMTDRKKRVSYYFDPETVKMVEKLASKTGWDKYEIVEAAVRDLYRKVFEE